MKGRITSSKNICVMLLGILMAANVSAKDIYVDQANGGNTTGQADNPEYPYKDLSYVLYKLKANITSGNTVSNHVKTQIASTDYGAVANANDNVYIIGLYDLTQDPAYAPGSTCGGDQGFWFDSGYLNALSFNIIGSGENAKFTTASATWITANPTAIGGTGPAFVGRGGLTVLFKNICFENCGSSSASYSRAAAVDFWDCGGKLKFDNCSFSKNVRERNAIVSILNTVFEMQGCVFANNQAKNGMVSLTGGGNYYRDKRACLINNSRFENNDNRTLAAGGDGGAIYAQYMWDLQISNTKISNNTTANQGGGIYFANYNHNIVLDNDTITNNTANSHGGGISFYNVWSDKTGDDANLGSQSPAPITEGNGLIRIVNSLITNNTATTGQGGGIIVNSGTAYAGHSLVLSIEGDSINRNTAQTHGGAISITGATTNLDLSVNGSWLNKNTANTQRGGGLNVAGSSTSLITIANSEISENVASADHGGGIAVHNGAITAITINGCKINGNSVTASGKGGGGLLVADATGSLTVSNSILDGNQASAGGAFLFDANNNTTVRTFNVTFDACLFTGNKATTDGNSGGAFQYSNNNSSFTANLSFINSTFYNNQLLNGGYGAIGMFNNGSNPASVFKMINCTAFGNIATTGGGAIRFNGTGGDLQKYFYNCIFEYNGYGSGSITTLQDIHFQNAPTTVIIKNSYMGCNPGNVTLSSSDKNVTGYRANTSSTTTYLPDATAVASFISTYKAIPLARSSPALTAGDAKYLTDLSISTDQLGATRLFADDKCAVGAVETAADADFVIEANGVADWADYASSPYKDIILKSTDASTGQLTGIPATNNTAKGVVKYQRTFSKKQWYAVGFPFDIASVRSDVEDYDDYDFATESYDDGGSPQYSGDYWVKDYNPSEGSASHNDDFVNHANAATTLAAGGYAIAFPSVYFGMATDESEPANTPTITFTSVANPALNAPVSDFSSASLSDGYTMTVNPGMEVMTLTPSGIIETNSYDYYCLGATNYDEELTADEQAKVFGLVNATDYPSGYSLKPFESLIVAKAITTQNNAPTGNTLKSFMGVEVIDVITDLDTPTLDGEPVSVEYYNLQGIRVGANDIRPTGSVYIAKEVYKNGAVKVKKMVK